MKRLLLLTIITLSTHSMNQQPSLRASQVIHAGNTEEEIIEDIMQHVLRYKELIENKYLSEDKQNKTRWKLCKLKKHPLYPQVKEALHANIVMKTPKAERRPWGSDKD